MDEEMEMAIAMSQAEAQQPRQVPQVKILKISNIRNIYFATQTTVK